MTSFSRIRVADTESAAQLCRQIEGYAGETGVTAELLGDELEIAFANPLPVQLLSGACAAVVWLARRVRAIGTPGALGAAATE